MTSEGGGESTHAKIVRKLSRSLSLVTKVPASILKLPDGESRQGGDGFSFQLSIIAPDMKQKIITCCKGQTIFEAASPVMDEFNVLYPGLYLAGSKALVDANADVSLLRDNILMVQECAFVQPDGKAKDAGFWDTEAFVRAEMEYCRVLKSAGELYEEEPKTDLKLKPFFMILCSLSQECSVLVDKLKKILVEERLSAHSIGVAFNLDLWDEYENYAENYALCRQLLREKKRKEGNFENVCKLRQGAAKHSLEAIIELPIQRLSDYEHYFDSLLNDAKFENQPGLEELNKAKSKCKTISKKTVRESDLERIQDLFPNDFLKLHEAEAQTMKVKGLMRKRSGAAARLQRALSTKSLRSESPPPSLKSTLCDQRHFIMEAPVQFTTGVQSQERHLFLFNDLLLVAKARSGGNFKLKEKVRVSEMWLSKEAGVDEVSEIVKSEDTSFVLGWPTTNVVVTFGTQAARDLWWDKLSGVFRAENEKEPCSTNIQVVYYDAATNIEYCKTFSIGPEETARECVKVALDHLGIRGAGTHEKFQLWAKTARDESPYPLIGHERPFAIKLSCLRDFLSAEDGFDLDRCNNVHDPVARCHFILRCVSKSLLDCNKKSPGKKPSAKSRIGHVFRRSLSKEQPSTALFGVPLCKISDGDTIPKPIMNMLYQVFAKGPFMQGIFRKSANARLVREIKDKLDAGEDVIWDHIPVLVTAGLLKDFLRSLPDPLLATALYPQWRAAMEIPNANTKLYRIKGILTQLPKSNYLLLVHFLCVLHHIARRSSHTLMSATNLGVCVGPSLLWSDQRNNVGDDLRIVPALLECLITHCEFLCGSHIPTLLGDLRDSGTEESDSMKRDDSSIDSLECSPPPRKDKISLSRDSGLTMSDCQLYTPDEEESGSTSSSGYDPAFESNHPKVSNSMSAPPNNEYVRVYGGWEERLNPNFQRQAWFRQRSRRIQNGPKANSTSATNLLPTPSSGDRRCRSHSQESLLNTPMHRLPPAPESGLQFRTKMAIPRRLELLLPSPREEPRHEWAVPGRFSEDSSTLSDEDCTPHVSRSNSRGNEICGAGTGIVGNGKSSAIRSSEACVIRGRLKRKEDKAGCRSRSLPPPPPPYRPPPPPLAVGTSRKSQQTPSYYEECKPGRKYRITSYMDEESYV